jgi:hypothetical protein
MQAVVAESPVSKKPSIAPEDIHRIALPGGEEKKKKTFNKKMSSCTREEFFAQSAECKRQRTQKLKEKHPELIPVIVLPSATQPRATLKVQKFLVGPHLTFGQFVASLRMQCKLREQDALFFFVQNTVPCNTMLLAQLHQQHNDNGFLVFEYAEEATFGGFLDGDGF